MTAFMLPGSTALRGGLSGMRLPPGRTVAKDVRMTVAARYLMSSRAPCSGSMIRTKNAAAAAYTSD